MFASRTIILTSRRLPTPTHLFELSYEFSFFHVGEGFRQPVSGGSEFRKLRCLASFSPRWNIDTQCLATASVSVSNGYLVSSKLYYDTGEVQKTTDPCGYITSFQYNAASPFFGVYLTTATNQLLARCVALDW
jgi:hypothetical protein